VVRAVADLVGLEMVVEVKVVEVRVAVGKEEEMGMVGKGRVVGRGLGEGTVEACRQELVWDMPALCMSIHMRTSVHVHDSMMHTHKDFLVYYVTVFMPSDCSSQTIHAGCEQAGGIQCNAGCSPQATDSRWGWLCKYVGCRSPVVQGTTRPSHK
jgi:hypothetical protein